MMIPPICLSVTKVAPSLETTKQSHNEVTKKKNANQHYPSVMRETSTNLVLIKNFELRIKSCLRRSGQPQPQNSKFLIHN